MPDTYKIAIIGASTLAGKELNEVLSESAFMSADCVLMDDDSQIGQLEAVGDEPTFIQRIEAGSFKGIAFAFFAGSEAATRQHWKSAQRAGASIVDLSYALENVPGVLVRAPWVQKETAGGGDRPTLKTLGVVPAHPAALALALLMQRLQTAAKIESASATVLEPASQYGRAAMDELHQQTVNLLNFQPLPKENYDAQVAFNAVPTFGEAAKYNLAANEERIRRHYETIAGRKLPEIAIQAIHAPVFHGYGISVAVQMTEPVLLEHLAAALGGEHVEVMKGDGDVPTNLSTSGQSEVLVRLRTANADGGESNRFWIWAALDNLKFAALNGVACALELRALRPMGKVQ